MLCEPSHIGGSIVCLQVQKKTFLDCSALYFNGINSVPLCDPSQNGCFKLIPQVHQKYDFPSTTLIPIGLSPALLPLLTIKLLLIILFYLYDTLPMNIRLYHPNSIVENSTELLSREHTHYVVNVMRLKRGSQIFFFNENGEWKSEIVFLEKNRVEIKILNKIRNSIKTSNVELAICLVKKNSMENILQKATELGVNKIIPIVSERTEVKELNYDRSRKIVTEATEQSNQLTPPKIFEVKKLKDFLKNLNESTRLLFADINSKNNLNHEDIKGSKSLCILIGPEGDFSPLERELILQNSSVKPFALSRNILKSDTAVISAISLVNFINNFN